LNSFAARNRCHKHQCRLWLEFSRSLDLVCPTPLQSSQNLDMPGDHSTRFAVANNSQQSERCLLVCLPLSILLSLMNLPLIPDSFATTRPETAPFLPPLPSLRSFYDPKQPLHSLNDLKHSCHHISNGSITRQAMA
jgi:hypothetical protein